MNWILENWGTISAISTPILLFIIGLALKRVPRNYRAEALKVVQAVEKKMIEANYMGNENITHNDDIKENMDKIKIDLGLDK